MPEDHYDSSEERTAAQRARLYQIHKAHGSLGTYYLMFPDEMPSSWLRQQPDDRER